MTEAYPTPSGRLPIDMAPAHPVGDPEPSPPTPGPPAPQRGPDEPVHAPRPSEPELPAVDPHEPGMPNPRVGDPRGGARFYVRAKQRWLI